MDSVDDAVRFVRGVLGPFAVRIGWAFLVSLWLVFLIGQTLAQGVVWQSDMTVWENAVQQAPRKPRALINYAVTLEAAGRLSDALSYYQRGYREMEQRVFTRDDARMFARAGLIRTLTKLGRLDEAATWVPALSGRAQLPQVVWDSYALLRTAQGRCTSLVSRTAKQVWRC